VTLAERVLRAILEGEPGTLPGRVRLKGAIEARRLLIGLRDPLVRYRIEGLELVLPLSHELPFYRNDHPRYNEASGRIAAQLGGPVVDVGANVGDTAAAIRAVIDVPILCVEGDERFFRLLERNTRGLDPPPELERSFVETPLRGRVETGRGTSRVVSGGLVELPSKPLARILDEHPRFAEPALLKLDTDGFDVPILLANIELLARLRPVLFFEYAPHLGAAPVIFERLRDAGYRRAHVYENTGEFVRSVELAKDDVHAPYVGHGGARYADVCAFSEEQVDLEP
jgi:FkbM family methyltransferase